MSLGIVFKGPEGIVLAADSRVTLQAILAGGPQQVAIQASYDNATKLLRVNQQNYVGVVTYGIGAIGQQQPRTAQSFIPEFEAELSAAGVERLGTDEFATKLSEFFVRQWNLHMQGVQIPGDMEFLVGGYDKGQPYGRVFEFKIPNDPTPREQNQDTFGITFGGQTETTARLLQGFDSRVIQVAATALKLNPQQLATLEHDLRARIGVDLSIFLIRATIEIQSLSVGIRGVGGSIDVATITRTDGFKAIQQKLIAGERRQSN
jgi:hypothetical protein